ncbi:MAG: TonB-dependent receptor [Thermoanaerobaculia bacterium]|nr:TonB-dependent receptor [Thermoanaerobaculia bacterium]
MRNNRSWLVLLVLPLLMASVLVAQGIPTGTILGRVINEGQGLPGTTVVAKSPALQGSRTAVTSANGDFAFVGLPPGDYTITFTMSGFQTVTRTQKVSASQQVSVNAEMSLSAVAAEATVVAQSETISQTATQATTYTADLLNKLPTGRTVTSAVILSPGLNQNAPNGISIGGAQSTENLYTVNGVVITDNVRSTANNLFIEDAIQETTTTTSSVSAEYGRFTGGVINSVTKSGGNTFSGSFRTSFNNDSWRAYSDYRDPVTGANPQEGTFVDKTVPTYEATLGGPIVKDRVWFFGAGRYYDQSDANSYTTRFTNIPFVGGTEELRYEAKLTITPFQNHTLTGSYINVGTDQFGYFFGTVADLESVYDRQLPQDLLAVNYNGVLTDSLFLDAQYSSRKFTFENSGGRFTDLVKGTVIQDLALGSVRYNAPVFCAVCGPEKRDNDNFLVKGTYFLSTKNAGSHNIVLGYDDFGGQRLSNNYQSASNFFVYTQTASRVVGDKIYPVINSSTELDWWPVLQESQGSDIRTRSFFVNDTWRLNNNLSFNLGLRYDKNDATDAGGAVTSDDDAFSPRLAATWDVTGNGKLRVTASYAKYVAALQETQAGSGATMAGAPADFWWYYDGPGINTGAAPYLTPNQSLEQLFAWFQARGCLPDPLSPGCTVPLDGASIGGVNVQIQEKLISPSANEYVLGFAGSIGSRGSYRADIVRREFNDYYDLKRDMTTGQVQNPLSGAMLDLGLIVNSDSYTREYTGLHTQFTYRIGNSLNVGGNWTWSHLLGDIVGETSGSGPTRGGVNIYPEYRDLSWNNPKGDLSSDTRHRVRVFGTWDTPIPQSWGSLSLNLVQSWDTGLPYGAVGAVASRNYVTNPGYRTPPSSVTYYYTGRDAFRTEDVYRTDLSLYYGFRIGGAVEIFISPQVYNVFNNQAVTGVNTAVETRVTNPANYAAFNPFTDTPKQGARNTGANWNYGPLFGQPTSPASYQAPRSFNFSVGVRF